MFCIKCGTQLPDEANFCWKCGMPQRADVQVDEPKWETCEIWFDHVKNGGLFASGKLKFWARAVGAQGVYTAGASEIWTYSPRQSQSPDNERSEVRALHGNLIDKLVKDGWESVGHGSCWYNDKFRRRVK